MKKKKPIKTTLTDLMIEIYVNKPTVANIKK